MTAPAALSRTAPTRPPRRVALPPGPPDAGGPAAAGARSSGPPGAGTLPDAAAGELVSGVTKRWGPHALTEARAREFGLDLLRVPTTEPAAGWVQRAACRGAPSPVADQLTEALSQLAASELVGRLCSACPVRTECFEMGRTTGGHGVWGGIVLREGQLAPWRTATERSRKMPAETTVLDGKMPAETTVLDGKMPAETTVAEPPNRRRGQRPQPRRLTRARRRGRHAPVA